MGQGVVVAPALFRPGNRYRICRRFADSVRSISLRYAVVSNADDAHCSTRAPSVDGYQGEWGDE